MATKMLTLNWVRLALILMLTGAGSAQADVMEYDGQEVSTNRVLVKFRPHAGVADLAAYPTLTFILGPFRRWRRRRRGLCTACGYNLTGNASGVCSECGEAVGRA